MTIWPALLLAPMLALLQQALTYSLVTPSCSHQEVLALHAVAGGSLLLLIAMTAMAGWTWLKTHREMSARTASQRAEPELDSRAFLAGVATAVGALSVLVGASMWWPIWILSPCLQ